MPERLTSDFPYPIIHTMYDRKSVESGGFMKLRDVLQGLTCTALAESAAGQDAEIADIVYDSRKAGPDNLFVCMVGAETDGHKYAGKAYEQGCRNFVIQADRREAAGLPEDGSANIIAAEDTRAALAVLSDNYFGHPSGDVKVVGITGTKGKTSTTYIIKSVLESAGIKVGLIGTAGAEWCGKKAATVNTTPESYELQKLLRQMADDGVEVCAMEVSSLGVKWHRTDCTDFFCGVFTNISPDHIGGHEHKTFEEYYSFKKAFFSLCQQAAACIDDPASPDMLEKVPGRKIFYGHGEGAEFRADNEVPTRYDGFMGIRFDLHYGEGETLTMDLSTPGDFSVENALAAISVCSFLGIGPEQLLDGMKQVRIPGRAQVVYMGDDFGILIDYAHNGLSLTSIIETVKAYEPKRIITLFGSVGDRAQLRRDELGSVSGEMADFTVITTDDPGFEDPEHIAADIARAVEKKGGKYKIIVDRTEAVKWAVSQLQEGDILLCCGKGHEKYMKVCGKKEPFDEEAAIVEALQTRGIQI